MCPGVGVVVSNGIGLGLLGTSLAAGVSVAIAQHVCVHVSDQYFRAQIINFLELVC